MKTDYYELLGVEQTATHIELKKAYRRKALQLHPDKNPDDVENTTRLFNDVRVAYETLSDPQERSWYDSHKFQILMEDGDRDTGLDVPRTMVITTAHTMQVLLWKILKNILTETFIKISMIR